MFQWIHDQVIHYFLDKIEFHLMAELVMDGWWLGVVYWLVVVVWELTPQSQKVFLNSEQ